MASGVIVMVGVEPGNEAVPIMGPDMHAAIDQDASDPGQEEDRGEREQDYHPEHRHRSVIRDAGAARLR
jgi:hypothetical protein